jgi:hypothetical protein
MPAATPLLGLFGYDPRLRGIRAGFEGGAVTGIQTRLGLMLRPALILARLDFDRRRSVASHARSPRLCREQRRSTTEKRSENCARERVFRWA